MTAKNERKSLNDLNDLKEPEDEDKYVLHKTDTEKNDILMDRAVTIGKEMIVARGYSVKEENDIFFIASNTKDKLCFFKKMAMKLDVNKLKECICLAKTDLITHMIIVYKTITSKVKNTHLSDFKLNIELFQIDTLQYNLTKHYLVPKHEVLSSEASAEFKSKFGTNFPVLHRNDAVSKFYGFSKGDVVKVTRRDGYVAWRIVR